MCGQIKTLHQKIKQKIALFLLNRYLFDIHGEINDAFLKKVILQSKTNRSNSDFSFIKKAYDQKDYPLWEKYSTNICNTRHINTIHQQK